MATTRVGYVRLNPWTDAGTGRTQSEQQKWLDARIREIREIAMAVPVGGFGGTSGGTTYVTTSVDLKTHPTSPRVWISVVSEGETDKSAATNQRKHDAAEAWRTIRGPLTDLRYAHIGYVSVNTFGRS